MRIGNLDGRLVVLTAAGAVDVERASDGQFGAAPQDIYDRWAEFTAWAASTVGTASTAAADSASRAGAGSAGQPAGHGAEPFDVALLDAPSPRPRQAFGVGLNYRDHIAESGLGSPPPEQLSVFTKFPSCITGPHEEITLPAGGHTDWEVELVAIIGTTAQHVTESAAWSHVAGLTIGQDISERITQLAAAPPQFSMGKSFPRFGPTGPWLVTVDEFDDPDDLELGCSLNGEQVQKSRTSHLISSVPQIIARLSAVVSLLPGDVIFTGTPAGVGMGRDPQRWLAPGDELVSWVQGIGEMQHRFVS